MTTSLIEHLPVPLWTGDSSQRRLAQLARGMARHPGDEAAHAELQASVARLYGLDRQTFHSVIENFPQVARQDRDRVWQAFASIV